MPDDNDNNQANTQSETTTSDTDKGEPRRINTGNAVKHFQENQNPVERENKNKTPPKKDGGN